MATFFSLQPCVHSSSGTAFGRPRLKAVRTLWVRSRKNAKPARNVAEAEADADADADPPQSDVQPAPVGGLQGYNHESYSADSSRMVAMQIPLYSTKDDPIPNAAWDMHISSAREELGKTNLPLPDGQARKEFMQFRMKDVCNKKNMWMIPAEAPKLHEDAGRTADTIPDGRAGPGPGPGPGP